MEEDEKTTNYFLWIDEVVNTIRGLDDIIEDSSIMNKVLRTFPKTFDPKVSSLEERKDLDSITLDKMHGIVTTYEMRIEINQSPKREPTFEYSKKIRKDKY